MSDKLELGLKQLLEDPVEQHFEPLDEFTTYRLAAQAVKASRAQASEQQDAQSAPPQARSASSSHWLLLAAAALLISGAVGFNALSARSTRSPQAPVQAAAVAIAPAQPTIQALPSPAPPRQDARPVIESTPHELSAAPAAAATIATTPTKPKRVTPRPATTPPEVAAAPQRDATWWIERAGAFELEQDWAQAEAAYKKAIEAKPEPTTLSFAHVALGNIYQRHLHRPDQALKHYEGYLSHARQGALAHEALLGSIWALKALDRPLDEARQIKRLLKEHPQSPSAQALKARLQDIYAQPLQ